MSENDRIQQALALSREGKKEEARRILDNLLRENPDNPRAWAARAHAAETREQAIHSLEQVLQLAPENEWAAGQLDRLQTKQDKKPATQNLSKQQRNIAIGCGGAGLIAALCICTFVLIGRDGEEVSPSTSQPPAEAQPALANTPIPFVPTAAQSGGGQTLPPSWTPGPDLAPAAILTQAPGGAVAPTTTQAQPGPAPPTDIPTAVLTMEGLTSPVRAGQEATLSIRTTPGTECFLSYTTPHGTPSEAQGLGNTIADGNGICSWTWLIGGNTNPGTGTLRVSVAGTTEFFDIVIQS